MGHAVNAGLSSAQRRANELRDSIRDDQTLDPQAHAAEWEKGIATISKEEREKIGDERFGREFDSRFAGISEHGRGQVAGNVHRRELALAVNEHNASVESRIQAAILEDDPRDTQESIDTAIAETRQAQSQGLIKNGAAREVAIRSAVFRGLTERMIRENPVDALEALEDRDALEFHGMDAGERESATTEAGKAVKSQEREVRAELSAHQRAEIAAKKAAAEAQFQAGLDLLDSGDLTAEWIRNAGITLGSTKRNQLTTLLRDGKKRADPAETNKLHKLMLDNPAAFASENLDPNKLGDQYDSFIKLQRQIQKDGRLSATEAFKNERVENTIKILELGTSYFQAPDEEFREEFRRRVDEEIAELRQGLSRAPDRAQIRAVIDGLTVELSRKTRGFSAIFGARESRRRFEVAGDAAKPFELKNVPAAAIEPLIDVLEVKGGRIDEAAIEQLYQETLERLSKDGRLPATPENAAIVLQKDIEKGLAR